MKNWIYKKADAISDVSNARTDMFGSLIGGITGLASSTPTDEDIQKYNRTSALGMLPGVPTHRYIQRLKHANKKHGGSALGKVFSENLGGLTSSAILAIATGLVGAGAGSIIGASTGNGAGNGALMGSLLGTGAGAVSGLLANIIGNRIGFYRSPRTKEEQEEYAQSGGRTAMHYLLPGVAAHDKQRTLKRLLAEDALIMENIKKDK